MAFTFLHIRHKLLREFFLQGPVKIKPFLQFVEEKNKYLKKCFTQCVFNNGSQFWKGVLETRKAVSWGLVSSVNNGENTLFWEDVWATNIPLQLEFPSLYRICDDNTLAQLQVAGLSCNLGMATSFFWRQTYAMEIEGPFEKLTVFFFSLSLLSC